MDRPLCFVLMPFGSKRDPAGGPDINFDRIYETAIRPGIEEADMEPIRADEERTGGIIHKAMFERLMLCDFAVADLTTANANVFYELGVRHAVRPATTLAIFASHQTPPFDVSFIRALPYDVAEDNHFGQAEAAMLMSGIIRRLTELRELASQQEAVDSPVFQLLGDDYNAPDLARLKTDVFREQVHYSAKIKRELAEARTSSSSEAITKIEEGLGSLDAVEVGVLIDLFLSYRAVSDWESMISLREKLPAAVKRSILVREQLAFAYNRTGNREGAIQILEDVINEQGASSETNGILGRVYKDQWVDAKNDGNKILSDGYLNKAIATYARGFEADWRDAYPGINAVTLLDIKGDEESEMQKAELLPVVQFAVSQRLKASAPDYWDHATLLELAVLGDDQSAASKHLSNSLAAVRESWEPGSTSNNLKLIREARLERGVNESWLDEIIDTLEKRQQSLITR